MRIDLVSIDWTDGAAAVLGPMVANNPRTGVDWYREQIEAGRVALLGVDLNGERVGYSAVRVDPGPAGREFVIMATRGAAQGADLTRLAYPELEAVARKVGASWVRVHTSRPGLCRKLERLGFVETEKVMRKCLA